MPGPANSRLERAVSKAEPFAAYLQARWQAGCQSPRQLWLEIRDQGFSGSELSAWRWIAKMRTRLANDPVSGEAWAGQPSPREVEGRRLSPDQAAWLLVRQPNDLKANEREWLEQFKAACEAAGRVHDLAQQFMSLVQQKTAEFLPIWIATARSSGLGDLKTFANGLQQDFAAVSNALKLPWSNGPTEGHVHRLKLIKRQMYGRAKFDLLRRRVLQSA